MSAVLRTEATDETQGFMKVLVDTSDRILGFAMIGSEAGAAVQTAMLAKLPYSKLRDAVIAHLTMAEGLGPLLGNVPSHAAWWDVASTGLIFWMYPVFGVRGASWFLGVSNGCSARCCSSASGTKN